MPPKNRGLNIVNPDDADLAEFADAADRPVTSTASTASTAVKRVTLDLEVPLHRALKRAAEAADMPVTKYLRALIVADGGVKAELAELERRHAELAELERRHAELAELAEQAAKKEGK
jgi:hypothetical protein